MSTTDGTPKLIIENDSIISRAASEIKEARHYHSVKDNTMKFIGHV